MSARQRAREAAAVSAFGYDNDFVALKAGASHAFGTPKRRTHGQYACYAAGCRCGPCREAKHAYSSALWTRQKLSTRKSHGDGTSNPQSDGRTVAA